MRTNTERGRGYRYLRPRPDDLRFGGGAVVTQRRDRCTEPVNVCKISPRDVDQLRELERALLPDDVGRVFQSGESLGEPGQIFGTVYTELPGDLRDAQQLGGTSGDCFGDRLDSRFELFQRFARQVGSSNDTDQRIFGIGCRINKPIDRHGPGGDTCGGCRDP